MVIINMFTLTVQGSTLTSTYVRFWRQVDPRALRVNPILEYGNILPLYLPLCGYLSVAFRIVHLVVDYNIYHYFSHLKKFHHFSYTCKLYIIILNKKLKVV